jgi:uncharacterized FAD-dependent dehydrogenase
MALRLREIKLHLDEDELLLPERVAQLLELEAADLRNLKLVRKGIDARRKSAILKVYTLEFEVADEPELLRRQADNPHLSLVNPPAPFTPVVCAHKRKVVVVGMGPAGLFAALSLRRSGAEVLLIERGRPVAERLKDVQAFWQGGLLNPQSNIQFGEGGAGTFSDGKLTTRINHPLVSEVLQALVDFGAPAEILWQAKPHIGSDRLRQVLVRMRKQLQDDGVEIRFSTCLTGIEQTDGRLAGAILNGDRFEACDSLLLAVGHSARDTYRMLQQERIALESKSFAIGLRVEHPLELINRIQYGVASHPQLGAAEYSLAWQDKLAGRGVYSFCMCPGGVVVNASSEPGGVVVNGMSDFKRDANWSNSALVVTVGQEDFGSDDPLAGVAFQRHWEEQAFAAAGSTGAVPGQPLLGFLHGSSGDLNTSCRPAAVAADLTQVLPVAVGESLRRALPQFERRMRGFIGPEAMLLGVETRTSAPLRILRDAEGCSVSLPGLFPAGEGAGYAGGIMSAAIDGIKTANNLASYLNTFRQG